MFELLPYGHSTLSNKHDTRELLPGSFAAARFHDEVIVVTEQHPPESRRSIQELRVVELMSAVFKRRNDIHSSEP